MSEQQFTIESERINTTYSVRILKDDEVIFEISNWNSLGEIHETECENIVTLLNELSDKNRQLEEENEELRKELNDFKPVMFQDIRGTVILYSKGGIDE